LKKLLNPPFPKGEKAESVIESIPKSSRPFEKGGREGFLGRRFQKAKLIRNFYTLDYLQFGWEENQRNASRV
jgi:hypothetical protein